MSYTIEQQSKEYVGGGASYNYVFLVRYDDGATERIRVGPLSNDVEAADEARRIVDDDSHVRPSPPYTEPRRDPPEPKEPDEPGGGGAGGGKGGFSGFP